MDENKDFEKKVEETVEEVTEKAEDIREEVTEKAEEIAEEVTEKAEEIVSDAKDAFENGAEAVENFVQEAVEEVTETAEGVKENIEEGVQEAQEFVSEVPDQPKKKNTAAAIIAAVLVVIAVVCLLAGMGKLPWLYNKYNHMGYVDVTGRTIGEIAKEQEVELSQWLESNGLPADMPANTQEAAAYYMMPLKKIAERNGIDFETMKMILNLGEDTTEEMSWGKVQGELTLEQLVGEEYLDAFKEQYGFGDEVTLDTKWKEVRNVVDLRQKEDYAKQAEEKETAAEQEPEEETDIAGDTEE